MRAKGHTCIGSLAEHQGRARVHRCACVAAIIHDGGGTPT
jgi:hypothetical protein